jgi:hypothetical protein
MITSLILTLALGAPAMHPDLDSLDLEVAQLRRERATLTTYSDNARRDQVDAQIRMLQTVANRSASIMEQRLSACFRMAPNGGALPPSGSPAAMAMAVNCSGAGNGVVGTVRRIEEIRVLLAAKRNWNDRDEAAGLQREIQYLESTLRTYY